MSADEFIFLTSIERKSDEKETYNIEAIWNVLYCTFVVSESNGGKNIIYFYYSKEKSLRKNILR